MTRLLWHSNAPYANTGYGQQTALFALPLKERYDLAISSFYGLHGNIIPWNGIPVLPGIESTFDQAIVDHASMFFDGDLRDGLVFTLMDVWVLDVMLWRQMNVCSWVPIDHQPAPRPVVGFFKDSGAIPIAMSKFGQRELKAAGLDPLYVPHAIDASVYKPHPKDESRDEMKMPKDAFIVGMVAANKGNPSRKCFVEAFQGFKLLHDRHPDARLYLHTEISGRFDGVNLPRLLGDLKIDPKLVMFCDQYRAVHRPFPVESMAKIYSALDVLLMPSAGEGFGIPAVEAQACGVPVIGSDFSAQPEVIGAGWLVGGHKHYTEISSWQFVPDVEQIYGYLSEAYALSESQRKQVSKKARAHAEAYDIETVLEEHMLPALDEVEQRFEMRKPVEIAA